MIKRYVKFIVLMLLLGLMMVGLTGCDDLAAPTTKNISDALEANGCFQWRRVSLDGNEEKIISTFTIDESNRESGDEYSCLVTVTTPYSYVTEKLQYHLIFKLDENNRWKCTKVRELAPPSNGSNVVLSRKISNADVKNTITGINYSLPNGMEVNYSDIYKMVIQEHKVDELGFTDRVTIKFCANYEYKKYEFTADVFFNYQFDTVNKTGEWQFFEADIDEYVKSDLSDIYKFEPTKGELYWIFKDCNEKINFETSYYTISEGNVTNFSFSEADQDGSEFLRLPCKFTYANDELTLDVSADIYFYFNNQGWRIDRLENVQITKAVTPIVGKWIGQDGQGVKYTIEISENTDENSHNIVTVTVENNGETYSYKSHVYSYKIKKDFSTLRIDFSEWINLPSNGDDYAYRDFNGKVTVGEYEIEHDPHWVATRI